MVYKYVRHYAFRASCALRYELISFLSAIAILSMLCVSVSALPLNAQSDLANNMCRSYIPVVERAIQLRQQGIPLQYAEEMANSAFITNRGLWRFLVAAIRHSYQAPDASAFMIRNGRMVQICVNEVRGY
jgi:hypothetical protein